MLRVAMISKWFVHAERFARYLQSYPECEIAAVWDYDVPRGQAWAAELGCPFVPRYADILADPSIQAVVVLVPVRMHADYIVQAAEAGKHIYTEKPLAGTVEDAYRIRDAIHRSGVQFTLSDPVIKPPLRYAKQLVDAGVLGKLTAVRSRITTSEWVKEPPSPWRRGHTGAEMCGGDLIDIGHHSVHILSYFLGQAEQAAALCTQVTSAAARDGAEDNAVAIYRFAGGAIGIAEAGSATAGRLYEVELFGTKGCLQCTKQDLRYCLADGVWVDVPEPEWPQPYPYILYEWVRHILEGRSEARYGIDEAVMLQEMIAAAYQAAEHPQPVVYR